uniref:MFS domain-containing protein n=1 Tax=Steinernema glaseri TaxID=37863 RepID=A0A1I7ZP39_9BILA
MKSKNRLIVIMTNVVILVIIPVGFHMVVLNVPVTVLQNAIRRSLRVEFNYYIEQNSLDLLWSLIVASQSFGALIGCYFILPLIGSYGTKSALLLLSTAILVLGSLLMAAAYTTLTPFLLLGGRTLTGVYIGLACSLVPIYLREVAPPNLMGAIGCVVHIAVCIGSALGAILSTEFILGSSELWGILMLVPAAIGSLLILLSIYIIPESPNYYIRYQRCEKASKSVDFYYCPVKDSNYNALIYYEKLVPEVPKQLSIRQVFSSPAVRSDVFVGMVVSAAQVFSGSMATISYSTTMFSSVSFVEPLISFLPAFGSLLSVVLTLPALKLVDSCGRRPLLLNTLCLCAGVDFLLAGFSLISQKYENKWSSYCFGISFLVYGVGYNVGIGPLAYFIPAELVDNDAVSVALGAAVSVNWVSTLLTTLVYYPVNEAVGGYSFLLFAIPTTFFTLILYAVLPETKPVQIENCLSTDTDDETNRLASRQKGYGTVTDDLITLTHQ